MAAESLQNHPTLDSKNEPTSEGNSAASDTASTNESSPHGVRIYFHDLRELLLSAVERFKQQSAKSRWERMKEVFPIVTPAAALIISGLTIYYGRQFNGRDARLKDMQLQFEKEKYDFERQRYIASEWPALQVRIKAQQESLMPASKAHLLERDERLIRVCVSIENVGTSKTKLDLSGGPLVVARVKSLSNGKMDLGEAKKFWVIRVSLNPKQHLDTRPVDEMRPKETDQFEFLANVEGAGLYALMFSAPVDKKEIERMKGDAQTNMEEPRGDPLRWDATTFFEVK